MADQALHLRPDADLEAALRAFGEDVAWPEAPADLAAIVRARIESSPRTAEPARSRWSWWPARRALVAAVLILLALAALAGAAGLGSPGSSADPRPRPGRARHRASRRVRRRRRGLPGPRWAWASRCRSRTSMPGRASTSSGRRTPPSGRPTPPTSIGRWVARSRSCGGRATGSPTPSSRESA